MIRETKEEVGGSAVNLFQVLRTCCQNTDGYSMKFFIFRAENFCGYLRDSDEAKPYWIDVGEIPYENMWPTDRYWLPLIIDRKVFTGYTLCDNHSVLEYLIKDGIE